MRVEAGDVAAAVSTADAIADVQDCPFFFPLSPLLSPFSFPPFDRGFAISIVHDSPISSRNLQEIMIPPSPPSL